MIILDYFPGMDNSHPVKCSENEFLCRRDKVCVSARKKCDHHQDCDDNSDEEDCGK